MSADSPTRTIAIRNWTGEDTNNGEWPSPPEYQESLVTGGLADRIRAAFGIVDPAEQVTIIEEQEEGGYSEWTSETYYACTVKCGTHSKEFLQCDGGDFYELLRWLDSSERVS